MRGSLVYCGYCSACVRVGVYVSVQDTVHHRNNISADPSFRYTETVHATDYILSPVEIYFAKRDIQTENRTLLWGKQDIGLIGYVVVRVDIDISRNINTWLDIETLTPCIVLRRYLNLMLGIEERKKNCSRVYPIYVV